MTLRARTAVRLGSSTSIGPSAPAVAAEGARADHELAAEALGLAIGPGGELAAADPVREARIVLDLELVAAWPPGTCISTISDAGVPRRRRQPR